MEHLPGPETGGFGRVAPVPYTVLPDPPRTQGELHVSHCFAMCYGVSTVRQERLHHLRLVAGRGVAAPGWHGRPLDSCAIRLCPHTGAGR